MKVEAQEPLIEAIQQGDSSTIKVYIGVICGSIVLEFSNADSLTLFSKHLASRVRQFRKILARRAVKVKKEKRTKLVRRGLV